MTVSSEQYSRENRLVVPTSVNAFVTNEALCPAAKFKESCRSTVTQKMCTPEMLFRRPWIVGVDYTPEGLLEPIIIHARKF